MEGGTGGGDVVEQGPPKGPSRGHTRPAEPGARPGQAGRGQDEKQQGRALLRLGPLTQSCW